jgi:hypothetical protein
MVAALAALCGCAGSTTSSNPDGAPQRDAGTDGSTPDGSTPDGGTPDGGTPDGGGPAFQGHRGTATVSGSVQATSSRFRVIMTTGQSPGGNNTASSSQHKVRGGLVGATQGP